MEKTRLGRAAAAVLALGASPIRQIAGARRRRHDLTMEGTRTPGIRVSGAAQREADAWNETHASKQTVSAVMAKAPRDVLARASVFHHVKGKPPRAGWTYRAARRNKAKTDRGARLVMVGRRVGLTDKRLRLFL